MAKCGNTVRVPKRSPAIIPKSLRKAHAFLQTSFGTRDRLLETSASDTVQVSILTVEDKSKIKTNKTLLNVYKWTPWKAISQNGYKHVSAS